LEEKTTTIKDALLHKGIGYHQFQMDEPLGALLAAFLKERKKIR